MIRPTILWALSLAMLGGALFGLRRLSAWWEVRALSPASRLGVGGESWATNSRPAPRPLTSGEGAVRQGHRVPSPVFVLAAARYGSTPSYAACLQALARIHRASQSEAGVSHQQSVASRPHAVGLRPH